MEGGGNLFPRSLFNLCTPPRKSNFENKNIKTKVSIINL